MPGRAGGKSTANTAKKAKAKGKSMDPVRIPTPRASVLQLPPRILLAAAAASRSRSRSRNSRPAAEPWPPPHTPPTPRRPRARAVSAGGVTRCGLRVGARLTDTAPSPCCCSRHRDLAGPTGGRCFPPEAGRGEEGDEGGGRRHGQEEEEVDWRARRAGRAGEMRRLSSRRSASQPASQGPAWWYRLLDAPGGGHWCSAAAG
eukprot:COSAG01_NODE_13067_length_1641_cov_4.555772_1_plen_202_part_00